ncbi:MAG TPA: helix-turn-helix domain-containing protein [Thermoanaerobacterales bacterium]|nr:helix-turn-helix domain-containing protein [Thermoanaerobacterales bacterium]
MKEIGDLLKEAREKSGKTLVDISNDTKIRKSYLQEIEKGNFDIIPGGEVYVKGFIRNYAKCVGIDGDMIVEKYGKLKRQYEPEDLIENHEKEPYIGKVAKSEDKTKDSKDNRTFLLTLGILLLAVTIFIVNKTGLIPNVEQPNEIDLPKVEDQQNKENDLLEEDKTIDDNLEEGKIIVNKVNETQKNAHYTINNIPEVELIVLSESCWVRIEVDDKIMTEETLFVGDERFWEGEGKIYILAGNPNAIEIKVNGTKINTSYNNPYSFVFERI